MAEPQWMIRARTYLGTKESPGTKHNKEILKWFEESGHGWIKDDETAWCAAFVNAMLARSGVKGTGSVAARSFTDWGKPLARPVPGCIAVFWRVKRDGWQGHVAFFVSETATHVRVLGGNQANSVSIANYAKSRLLGYRWPGEVAPVKPMPKPAPEVVPVSWFDSLDEKERKKIVTAVQKDLLGHGYTQVGGIDGLVGDRTRSAVSDFRRKNSLPDGEHIDQALIEALGRPDAVRPVIAPERANASLDDLQKQGSVIADSSKKGTLVGKVATVGTTAVVVGEEVADRAGLLYSISGAMEPIKEFGAEYGVWILAAVIIAMGGFIWWQSRRAGDARLRDHQAGNTSIVNLPEQEQRAEM
jgi:uncharacterized protein (TIGR02594 family)